MPRAWFNTFPRRVLKISELQSPTRRCMSKLGGSNKRSKVEGSEAAAKEEEGDEKRWEEVSPSWAPHPRTGIYCPAGHERVMDDIPKGAASFTQTYWLRGVDGVDKPDADVDYQTYNSKRHY